MNSEKFEDAYLAGIEMTQREPENEAGYRVAVLALYEMSKLNYSQINALTPSGVAGSVPANGEN